MEGLQEVLLQALGFIKEQHWWPLMGLVIGFAMRTLKPDVKWIPINVPSRWRPLALVALGILYTISDMLVGGSTWKQALQYGASAATMALMGHVFGIEMGRNGKELPMPGVKPQPPAAT